MDCLNGCLRSKHSFRAVRITAQNDFVPNLARNAKETLGRVNSVIPNAQEIELERDLQTLCSFAQARHVCVVNDGLARKMEQIQSCQILNLSKALQQRITEIRRPFLDTSGRAVL